MNRLDTLKEQIRAALPELDVVIGWRAGKNPAKAAPLFIRKEEDLDKLVIGPSAAPNLARYLHDLRGKKVGLVVKGCDSRSVVELLQEKLVTRDNLVIFGLPCIGVVEPRKVAARLGLEPGQPLDAMDVQGEDALKVAADGKEVSVPLDSVLAERCLRCRYPNPLAYDHLAGEPVEPRATGADPYADLERFEYTLDLPARLEFWKAQMNRCVRCYACRNACPLCACRNHCVADSREPHWLSQESDIRDKWMFQIIHAMHTAGRCTECGECERACPMGIPVMLLKRKLGRTLKDLFDYEAGIDPAGVPPLHTFQAEEKKIEERGL